MNDNDFQDLFRIWWDDLCVAVSGATLFGMFFVSDTTLDVLLAIIAITSGFGFCVFTELKPNRENSEFNDLVDLVIPPAFLVFVIGVIHIHYLFCWLGVDERGSPTDFLAFLIKILT